MRLIIIIVFGISCVICEAQKKYQPQKTKKNTTDFAYLMIYADNLFKQGEYIKASRLYDICANAYESESPRAKKQKDKCNELFKLQEEAFLQFTRGNFVQATAKYDKILTINSTDITSKNFRKNILEIQSTPPVNDLEIILYKANELFQKGRLTESRILYKIIIGAPEKYKTPFAQARINEIDNVNAEIKGYYSLAIQNLKKAKEFLAQLHSKYGNNWPPIKKVDDDYVYRRRDFLALVNSADQMFIEGYYNNALANYKEAIKIPYFSDLIRGKSRILNCEAIIQKKEQNAQLIADPGMYNIIVGNFKYILNLNYKDSITRNEYYDYIKKDLIAGDKYNDCNKIKVTIVKLTLIHKNRSIAENIDSLTSDCNGNVKCFIYVNTFKENLKEIDKYILNARSAKDLINIEHNLKKLQLECNINDRCLNDSLCNALKNKLEYTQKKLQKQQCIVKADNLLKQSDSLFVLNSCNEAMQILKKIDTTCLMNNSIKLYKNAFMRSIKCFKLEMYNLYMDSTIKQTSKKYLIDVNRLLDSALVYAPDSVALHRTYCMRYPENCTSEEKDKEICKDTTRSERKIEVILGLNPLKFISKVGISPLSNQFVYPNLKEFFLIGLRYNFIKYRRHFDFPLEANFYKINTEIPSSRLSNKFIAGSLDIRMFEFIPQIKWHTIAPCPNKPRYFITAGLTGGYSWSNSVSKNLFFVEEFKTTVLQPLVGLFASTGFDLLKPKKFGIEAAIFYSRKGSLYDHHSKNLTSPFDAKTYYTLIGVKLGFRLW